MYMCVCVCVCVCVHACMFRIVSVDKILHFIIDTKIIIITAQLFHVHPVSCTFVTCV